MRIEIISIKNKSYSMFRLEKIGLKLVEIRKRISIGKRSCSKYYYLI